MGASDGGNRASPWLLSIAVLICCAGPVRAEDAPETNTSVITAEDIRRERPASVKDLLRTRAGVDDSSGAITLRGVQGVAVVLNGLPSSLTEIGQLSLDDLERIEILRGAASARFGANAMGGAIVVTTRRRAARPALTLLGSSAGSLGFRFGGETALEQWRLGMTAKDEHEQGTRRVPVAPYSYQITVDPERYRKLGATLRAGYKRDAASLGLELKHTDSMTHYGRPNWWRHYVTTSGRLSAEAPLAPGIALELVAGHERYDDLGLRDTGTGIDAAGLAPDRHIASTGDSADIDLAIAWRGEATGLRLGAVYRREQDRFSIRSYGGSEIFALDAVTINRAAFVRIDRRFGALAAVFDGRLDRHEYPAISVYHAAGGAPAPTPGVVKQSFNPKLDLRWRVAQGVSLNASAGTGFVPPSPYQLYYSDTGSSAWMLGNPALKPQRSLTRDVGVSLQRGDRWSVAASLFHTAWTDKIGVAIIDYGTPLKRQFANIGAAAASGLEFESRLQFADDWSASLNYTFNRTRIVRNQANPERVGNALPDMPRHKLNAALAYESPEISGRLAMRAVSASFTDEANTVIDARGYRWEKEAYAVLDAAVTRRFRDIDLTVAVDNLFDRRHTTGFFRLGQPRLLRLELARRL